VGKLAGLTVIFDVDFTSRRISVELTNVTLEQALNIVAWKAKHLASGHVEHNFRGPDQAQEAQGL